MISVLSDQTGQTRQTSQKIGINFKTSWLRLRVDLKTEHLQQSWLKADLIWILDFFFSFLSSPHMSSTYLLFPWMKGKACKIQYLLNIARMIPQIFLITITLEKHGNHNFDTTQSQLLISADF